MTPSCSLWGQKKNLYTFSNDFLWWLSCLLSSFKYPRRISSVTQSWQLSFIDLRNHFLCAISLNIFQFSEYFFGGARTPYCRVHYNIFFTCAVTRFFIIQLFIYLKIILKFDSVAYEFLANWFMWCKNLLYNSFSVPLPGRCENIIYIIHTGVPHLWLIFFLTNKYLYLLYFLFCLCWRTNRHNTATGSIHR